MTVRMRHPDIEGTEIAVPSEQVPHLANSGWYAVEGQDEQGEVWPAEIQRFEGQPQIRMRHPDLGEGQVITVAESAVAAHRSKGWLVIGEEPEVAAEEEPKPARRRGRQQQEAEGAGAAGEQSEEA